MMGDGSHFYYSDDGRKITLRPSGDSLAIAYRGEAPPKEISLLINGDEELAQFAFSKQLEQRSIVIYKRRAGAQTSWESFAARLLRSDRIAYVTPVFYVGDTLVVVTDEFVAAFKPEVSRETIEQLNDANNVEMILDRGLFLGENTFLLRVKNAAMRGSIDAANRYFETGLVEYSAPDFIQIFSLNFPFTPNDPLFKDQWHLPRIKAPEAWDITRGDPAIIVAVLDSGIETGHDEFNRPGKVAASKDFFFAKTRDVATPVFDRETHGTSTSGLAVADSNNGKGVSGVAPNCRLIAVRIGSAGIDANPPTVAASGLNFAVSKGAAVISNSWSVKPIPDPEDPTKKPIGPLHPALKNALDNAAKNGRGGKGCVVFFSAGNKAGPVSEHSAPAAHPSSIAVAAVNDGDRHSGYSNVGKEVSISAPSDGTSFDREFWKEELGDAFVEDGSTRGIITTDRMGPLLGENAPGADQPRKDPLDLPVDYTSKFGGTSAACPQAAGVAALMLSINPDLTSQQVRYLLEATAEKVDANNTTPDGRYQPNGHSKMYGFGLINAFEAVRAARASVAAGDFVQKIKVKLKRESGDRFVSTVVLHAIDARQRRSDTATDSFVRSGGDGFLRVKMDSEIGELVTQIDVNE